MDFKQDVKSRILTKSQLVQNPSLYYNPLLTIAAQFGRDSRNGGRPRSRPSPAADPGQGKGSRHGRVSRVERKGS